MKDFWENRFRNESYALGMEASDVAKVAETYFRENNVSNIIIPGIGYGRNAKYFTDRGYAVDGLEIAEEAINIGKMFAPKVNFINHSALKIIHGKKCDAVFCFDLLQLFMQEERQMIIDNCARYCKADGIVVLSCLSTKDILYNIGYEVEPNSFEYMQGFPIHFADEEEMTNIHEDLQIIKLDYSIEVIHKDGARKDRSRIYGIYKKV